SALGEESRSLVGRHRRPALITRDLRVGAIRLEIFEVVGRETAQEYPWRQAGEWIEDDCVHRRLSASCYSSRPPIVERALRISSEELEIVRPGRLRTSPGRA